MASLKAKKRRKLPFEVAWAADREITSSNGPTTHKTTGFGLFDSLAILGKLQCLARIERALASRLVPPFPRPCNRKQLPSTPPAIGPINRAMPGKVRPQPPRPSLLIQLSLSTSTLSDSFLGVKWLLFRLSSTLSNDAA